MVISKYDIRGFVSSLRVDAIGAVHEALVKHFISKLLKSIYGLGDLPE
jgi:hypothetical protein